MLFRKNNLKKLEKVSNKRMNDYRSLSASFNFNR